MRRSSMLTSMRKFLDQQQITSAFEITINPQAFARGDIVKRRSIFVTGLQETDQAHLEQLVTNHGIQNFVCRFYTTLEQLEQSDLIDRNSSSLENNWRGRILRSPQDFNWNINDQQFDSIFLKSYFRLIVSYVNGEYFGRHDIAPVFYNPGHSTAGFPDFRGAVDGLVKFVNRGRDIGRCIADPNFDFLRAFVTNRMGQGHQLLNLDGHQEIQLSALFNRIDGNGEVDTIDWLYGQVDQAWNRNP